MELSYSHRFIFIHVYRVAGQSVSRALQPYSVVPRRLTQWRLHRLREFNYGHVKASELKTALRPELFDTFFKFSFVRNPWDWQVSVFEYQRQNPDHPHHGFFSTFRTFDDYLEWRVHEEGPELQSEFVMGDSGEPLVDFVGRYERLAEDFGRVCARLGVEASLPHRNRSKHGDFRQYYTPATRALVSDAYRDDIERFGYAFD